MGIASDSLSFAGFDVMLAVHDPQMGFFAASRSQGIPTACTDLQTLRLMEVPLL